MRQKILAYEVTKLLEEQKTLTALEIADNTFNSKIVDQSYQISLIIYQILKITTLQF